MVGPIQSQTVERKFLTHATPESVYEYLEGLALRSVSLSSTATLRTLRERKEPIIDLALASFSAPSGRDVEVLKDIFEGGNTADVIAICGNRNLHSIEWILTITSFIEEGPTEALCILLQNPCLTSANLCDVLQRKGVYSVVSDAAWYRAVSFALEHPYFSDPLEYSSGKIPDIGPFRAVWKLLLVLPVGEDSAASLVVSLGNFEKCSRLYVLALRSETEATTSMESSQHEFLDRVFTRWKVDDDETEGSGLFPSGLFCLRMSVAALVAAFDVERDFLKSHSDPAARRGFYMKCSPSDRDEFQEWLERDGRNFIFGALQNPDTYKEGSVIADALYRVVEDKSTLGQYMDSTELWYTRSLYDGMRVKAGRKIDITDEDIDLGVQDYNATLPWRDMEGLVNKIDHLTSEVRPREDQTAPLREAVSSLTVMAHCTNQNLLSVAKALAAGTRSVASALDRLEQESSTFRVFVLGAAGGIAVLWLVIWILENLMG